MPRPDKVAVVEEVSRDLTDATATVLTDYRGLTVDDLAELRAKLRASDARYKVVKNTLARLAASDAGLNIPDDLLLGPTAITFCAGDPVAAAKVLRTFSRQHPALVIKGGVLEGRVLGAEETTRLADLESREELLARLAGMMQTIIAQPARLAQAQLSKFARLLAALQDRKASEPQDVTAAIETEAAAEPSTEASGTPTEDTSSEDSPDASTEGTSTEDASTEDASTEDASPAAGEASDAPPAADADDA